MPEEVYRHEPAARDAFPWMSFVRASSLHIGAAAATASLRRELVVEGRAPSEMFDEAFVVSRLTPGTNLLALSVLLGRHFAGWRGALQALMVSALVPSLIACSAATLYAHYASHPMAASAMRGARAGALSVLLWAAVRLLRPQLVQHRVRGAVLAIGALIATLALPVSPTLVLLVSAGVGAACLRGPQ